MWEGNGKARILLVDDDELLLHSLKGLLQATGYEVITACDGLQGLREIGRAHV